VRAGAISHLVPFNGGLLVGCGMGGSGFAIDASKYMLEDYGYQVIVNKSHVPRRMWARVCLSWR
jgi:glucose-6-phosphate isomerase